MTAWIAVRPNDYLDRRRPEWALLEQAGHIVYRRFVTKPPSSGRSVEIKRVFIKRVEAALVATALEAVDNESEG